MNNALIKPVERENIFRHEKTPYIFGIVIGFFLMLLELPYRDIHIPQTMLIAVGLFCAIFLAFITFENMQLTLLLLVSYVPFSKVLPGDFGGFLTAFNMTNLFFLAGIVGWFARRSFRDEIIYNYTPLDLPILFFMAWSFIAFMRVGTQTGFEGLKEYVIVYKRWITPILYYFLFTNNVNEEKEIKHHVVVMSVVFYMIVILGLKQFYMDMGSPSCWERGRLEGITDQPNNMGAFYSYYGYFPLAIWLFHLNIAAYWIFLIPPLLAFRAMTCCVSRGAIISSFIGLFAVFWFKDRRFFLILLILVLLMFLFPEKAPESISGRFVTTFKKRPTVFEEKKAWKLEKTMEGSARSRIMILKGGIKMIKAHPIFGVGYDRFPCLINRYMGGTAGARASHNLYLLFAAEFGLPALAIFVYILFRITKGAIFVYRYGTSLFFRCFGLSMIGTIFSVWVCNIFGERLIEEEVSSYFWISVALLMRAETIIRNQLQKNEEKSSIPVGRV